MIFCFGELLLRMSPGAQAGWIDDASMPVYIGGAELNVATALAGWKTPARYCTALPDHALSQDIIDSITSRVIDTRAIRLGGERIGIYYLPQGNDLKHAGVIYDRAHSSFAELKPGMLDWNSVLQDCDWFHFSAISPALNASVAAVCLEALQAAKARGMRISVDLNYRAKLWQYGQHPPDVMPALVAFADVVMGNMWSAQSLLGINAAIGDSTGRSIDELTGATHQSMLALQEKYPAAGTVAYTLRLEQEYVALMRHGGEQVVSFRYPVKDVVDKVGSGDCFMAGLIYGVSRGHSPIHIINFAAAAAVGKLRERGDSTRQTLPEVEETIAKHKGHAEISING